MRGLFKTKKDKYKKHCRNMAEKKNYTKLELKMAENDRMIMEKN